jgi:hypothetical protein
MPESRKQKAENGTRKQESGECPKRKDERKGDREKERSSRLQDDRTSYKSTIDGMGRS